jgi:hypothetical protein
MLLGGRGDGERWQPGLARLAGTAEIKRTFPER